MNRVLETFNVSVWVRDGDLMGPFIYIPVFKSERIRKALFL